MLFLSLTGVHPWRRRIARLQRRQRCTSSSIAGNYLATVFEVNDGSGPTYDVLEAGGSLTINITSNNTTTGSLVVPASIGGGMTGDMAGTATVSGSTVQCHQDADTFVRAVAWTTGASTLSVTNQVAGGGTFTITLTKH